MREMKESGIEWIGVIPINWNILPNKRIMRKVKNILENYDNQTILSLTMKGVIARDLDNPSGKMPLTFDGYQHLSKGDLLMCLFDIDVTPRCIGIVEQEGVTSPAYSRFELYKMADTRFYYYYYLNLDYTKELLHLAKNLRHSLTENQLGEISVVMPLINEQRIIADYLDNKCAQIDRIIEQQQSVIEKLKEYKQSVITEAVTKGLNPDVPMKDSGVEWIGMIPVDFNCTKLRAYCIKIGDIDHKMPEAVSEGIPYISASDFTGINEIDFDNAKHISDDSYLELSKKIIPEFGDIIFARYATIGTLRLVETDRKFLASYSCVVIKANKSRILPKYLYYALLSDSIKEETAGYANANTQSNVGIDSIYRFKIVVPTTLENQKNVVEFLDVKSAFIEKALQTKNAIVEKLSLYKKSLIYEAVTGKIDLS